MNKTALEEFIEDILSGKVIDTLSNQNYYLEKERQQIEDAFVAGDERGTKEIPFNAEQYYAQSYPKN